MPAHGGLSRGRLVLLTSASLCCFAANSLLCRLALRPDLIDPASFMTVRLASGALVLWLLARPGPAAADPPAGGGWAGALWLFAYAVCFSFAYARLTAGTGALILFGTVQATMIGVGIAVGERPRAAEWVGLLVAAGGLVALALPGLGAPDPAGAALMAGAGVGWAFYSLRGRSAPRPVVANARNFARALPLSLAVSALGFTGAHASAAGIALALASGAVASGLGYVLWYAALRGLSSTRAGIVQLSVPALAAAGGVLLLDEALTARLLASGAAILGGVLLATLGHAFTARG